MLAPSAAIFSLLLILTGAAKMARPHDVEKALTALGAPGLAFAGVLIGVVEVSVGISALFLPGVMVVQGAMYLAFAGWVALALRADVPIASCGCLGRDDTPPTVAHIVLDVIAAGLSLGAGLLGDPIDLEPGLGGIAVIAVIGVGVFLAYVILTDGARLVGVRRT
jgi:hypothetical protein